MLFLTIDHINNDGKEERLKRGGRSNQTTGSWYLKLRREPNREDLQVLCFNCNLGKQVNKGVCPHKHLNVEIKEKKDGRRKSLLNRGTKIDWPTDETLFARCKELGYKKVSVELGVHISTVWYRIKRRKLI